jgi:hypothetical protein
MGFWRLKGVLPIIFIHRLAQLVNQVVALYPSRLGNGLKPNACMVDGQDWRFLELLRLDVNILAAVWRIAFGRYSSSMSPVYGSGSSISL